MNEEIRGRQVGVYIIAFIVSASALGMLWGYTSVLPAYARTVKQLLDYLLIILCFFGLAFRSDARIRYSFFLMPIVYWLIYSMHRYGGGRLNLDILNVLEIMAIGLFYPNEWVIILKIYRKTLVAVSFLGIIAYMGFFFIPSLPHIVSEYYLDAMGRGMGNLYYNYYFSVVLVGVDGIRLCGLFDEPGRFGTILALILIADNLNLRRIGNIIMLAAALFTQSVAAVAIIVIYACFVSIKNIKVGIAVLLLAIFVVYVLPGLLPEDYKFTQMLERFQFVDGKMVGNNRDNSEVDRLMQMQMQDQWASLVGYGTGAVVAFRFTTLSFLNYVFQYGIIGTALMFTPPIILALRYCQRNYIALVYVVCFCISLYQRPHLYTLSYFILLFGGIQYILLRQEEQERRQEYDDTADCHIPPRDSYNLP